MLNISPTSQTTVRIADYIRPLFPHGTRGIPGDITEPPVWPLDIFGAAAHVLKSFDAYTAILDHTPGGAGTKVKELLQGITPLAEQYRKKPSERAPTVFLKVHWDAFISGEVCPLNPTSTEGWLESALALAIFCDSACKGIGFPSRETMNWISLTFLHRSNTKINTSLCTHLTEDWSESWEELLETLEYEKNDKPYPTGCLLIPPSHLCVLPKSRTPMVGCTLRSLTHNLSLHPSAGQITNYWFSLEHEDKENSSEMCKIMVIPYPYRISSKSFKEDHIPSHQAFSTFSFSVIESIGHADNDSACISPLVEGLLDEAH